MKNKVCLILLFLISFSIIPESRKNILLFETMPIQTVLIHSDWFVRDMTILCEEAGIPILIKRINAEGDRKKGYSLLEKELSLYTPDIIVTNATMATQIAYDRLKGTDIPIIFLTVSDPVGAGLIKVVGVPSEENITGKVHTIDRSIKIDIALKLLKQVIKDRPVNFGFIHSTYPSAVGDLKLLKEAAKLRRDVNFVVYPIEYRKIPDGLPVMLGEMKEGIEALEDEIDFWWQPSGPLGEISEYNIQIKKYSNKKIFFGSTEANVAAGALLHITPDLEQTGRETAMLAIAVLQGADPGNLPPSAPSAFKLGINLKTALELKIVIPPDIMELAGDHIYK